MERSGRKIGKRTRNGRDRRGGIAGGVGAAGNASAKDPAAKRALEERAREQAKSEGEVKKKAKAHVKMQTSAMPGAFAQSTSGHDGYARLKSKRRRVTSSC
jgi:hypothetical protein